MFYLSIGSSIIFFFSPNLTWRSIQHLLVQTSKKHNLADSDSNYQWQENGAKFQSLSILKSSSL